MKKISLPVEVTLKPYELLMGSNIGAARTISSIQGKFEDRIKRLGKDWTTDIQGALGEVVVAKITDRYWPGTINTFKNQGDVGDDEVRTTNEHNKSLIVRPDERGDAAYWLVTTEKPSIYRVQGWMHGDDAKQKCWLKDPNNDGPAYFVPSGALQKDWTEI
jgi:hypothetical protein